jgi:hypothetical protein
MVNSFGLRAIEAPFVESRPFFYLGRSTQHFSVKTEHYA